MNTVTVRHRFEAAHRLPQLGGKCVSLHGHSWRVAVKFGGAKGRDGVVAEFGMLKGALGRWLDINLDHGVMLGVGDPLIAPLREAGTKVYRFGVDQARGAEVAAAGLFWPTVENVAELLGRVSQAISGGVAVLNVKVQETHRNIAEWAP